MLPIAADFVDFCDNNVNNNKKNIHATLHINIK